ncbi:unnamed protein product, partial [Ceratitis capitata]
ALTATATSKLSESTTILSGTCTFTTIQQRFMSPQVAQRPQLHPQRPNIFNRPQYQIGPNQLTGLYQYPQGYHNYYQQQTQRNQHYNPPPRPIAQKPQPKPEPMDINYANRPNRPNLRYAGKRQPDQT